MATGTILLLAALAVLAVAGARVGFRNLPMPVGLRPLFETGTVFIGIGMALGPSGANLLTAGLLSQLSPVIVIGLGWIGFLYGSHFEWRLMRRYPPGPYAVVLAETLVTFAVVGGACWLLLSYLLVPELPAAGRLTAAAILGVCAMGTAPAGVFHLSGHRSIGGEDLNLLRFLAAADDLPALVLLGLAGAFLRPELHGAAAGGAPLLPAWLWLAFTLGIGIGLGLVTHWLFPERDDVRENSLVLLGIVSLGAGAAELLRLSPLFVTALAGMVFANLSPRKERAYGLLADSEHTLYTVFLLVAGLLFRVDVSPLLVLVPAYLLLRALGKLAGCYAGLAAFLPGSRASPLLGAGMLYQGGMALAMAVSFQSLHADALDRQATTAVVVGVVVFELAAPWIAQAALAGRRR